MSALDLLSSAALLQSPLVHSPLALTAEDDERRHSPMEVDVEPVELLEDGKMQLSEELMVEDELEEARVLEASALLFLHDAPPLPFLPPHPAMEEATDDGDKTEDEGPPSPRSSFKHSRDDAATSPCSPPSFLPSSLPPLPLLPFTAVPTAAPLISFLPSCLPPLPSPLPAAVALPLQPPPYQVPEDAGIIRCVCSYTSDDGFTIQCDSCNVWQHANCVSIRPEAVPEEYLCELCDPAAARERGVDRRRAEDGQRRRTENETRGEGMRRVSSAGAAKPRRSIGEETPPVTPAPPPVVTVEPLTAGTVLRDAIGRRRRVGKQPGTGVRGRGGVPVTPVVVPAVEVVPELVVMPRLASLGMLRGNNTGPASDEDDGIDERYETWQYEFTPVEKNLWPARRLVERLEKVLSEMREEEPSEAKELWGPGSARGRTTKDALLPTLFDPAPIDLDVLPPPAPTAVKPLATTSFQLVAPVAATYVPTSNQAPTCPYPRPTVHALFAVNPIPAGTFISSVRGRITSLDSYRLDPVNQYPMLGVPKQGVRVLPQPWSLAIDSRMFGNEVRFARSGCHPNAVVRAVRVGKNEGESRGGTPWMDQVRGGDVGAELAFAVFATGDIGRKEEIVLPWDWDDQHVIHALPSLMNAPPLPPSLASPDLEPLSRKMAAVTNTLLGTTDCACDKKRDCALFWMCRAAGATAPLTRAAAAKREPFATILMNALGSGKEEGGARGKARKAKKPDVGPLVGIERGWIAKEVEPVVEEDEDEEDDEMVEEDDEPMEDVKPAPELVKEVEPTPPVPAVVVPKPLSTPVNVDAMELEPTPEPKASTSKSSTFKSVVKSSSSKQRRPPPPKVDDVDSDDSDLTEPLSHLSDEEEEEVVRPPPRRHLVSAAKRTAKEIGPARKKIRSVEGEKEWPKKKINGDKGKGVSRDASEADKDSERERARQKKKKVGKDSEQERPAKEIAQRPRGSTLPSSSKPPKIRIPSSSDKPSQSRSPSPNPPTATPRLGSVLGLFDSPATSTKSTPGGSPVLRNVGLPEIKRKSEVGDMADGDVVMDQVVPEPSLAIVVELPTPVVEVKEPTPPPPEPEAPKPPPRARLSLAAYRQRQAAKPVEVAAPPPPPPPPPPEEETAPIVEEAPIVVKAASPPPPPPPPPPAAIPLSPPRAAAVVEAPRPYLSPPTQPRSFNSTEDVLKSIGDYFARDAFSSAPNARPPPSGPLSYTRPVARPVSPSHTSPRLASAPAVRSPPFQPASDLPNRGPPNGLGLDAGPPSTREYGRQPAVYTGSSYSSTKYDRPLSPALFPRPLPNAAYSPPMHPGGPPALHPTPSTYNAPPPPSAPRPSPPVRPYDPLYDVPTAPRGMPVSPGAGPARGGFGRPFPAPARPHGFVPARASPELGGPRSPYLGPAPVQPPSDYQLPTFGSPGGSAFSPSLPVGPRGFQPTSTGTPGPAASGPPAATPNRASWPPPGGNPAPGFRGMPTPRGRFEPAGTPTQSAGRGRYEGVPRGPSSMHPSRGGRGGRGGPPPGWGARGRGRGRGA